MIELPGKKIQQNLRQRIERVVQMIQSNRLISRRTLYLALVLLVVILGTGGYIYRQNKQVLPQTKTLSTKKLPIETRENLKIDRRISTGETSIASQKTGYTKTVEVVITNSSDQPLKNVRFVERIPKEIAKSIEELTFNIQPTAILNKDPDVIWEFGEMKPKRGIKIVYETWNKVTDPTQGEPKIEELVKAVVATMTEEKPRAEIPEQSKDYTSIASLLRKVAIEKKEDEVIDQEFWVHGVIIKPFRISPLERLLGGLFVKIVQAALDSFMPDEVIPQPVKDKLGEFKDAGIESAFNFVMDDLHLILGDLPKENEVEINGAKIPPIFTLYNWPLAKTPELEPGHVFSGKVKLVKLLNGTFHLQILPGFTYDDPLGYVPLYELNPNLNGYKGKEVTTIGRVVNVEEKEGDLWIKVTLDGYRHPNAREKNIFGYSLWAILNKGSSAPQKNSVLTLTGVIKEAKFDRSIEYQDDNRLYLAVGVTSEQKANISPTPETIKSPNPEETWPPVFPGLYKVGTQRTRTYEQTTEFCQSFMYTKDLEKNPGDINQWYRDKLEADGWEITYDDQVTAFKKGEATFDFQYLGRSQDDKTYWERIVLKREGMRSTTEDERAIDLCWTPLKETPILTTAPSGQTMTVAEFKNMPNGGCGFGESDPVKPIIMELEIIKRIEEELAEKFIKTYKESGEELPIYAACPLYDYEGKDNTGMVGLCVVHCDREYEQCIVPSKKLEVGKKYLLKGCRPYVGTGGPGPEPITFGVREDWENAIVEK